jgi:hypothetical protein
VFEKEVGAVKVVIVPQNWVVEDCKEGLTAVILTTVSLVGQLWVKSVTVQV